MELSADRPRFACAACRRLKKKCDRREPRCTHCSRNRRRCAYSEASINELPVRPSTNRSRSPTSGAISDQCDDHINRFPEVYFLDSDLFQRSIGQLPSPRFAISSELQSFIRSKSSMRDHTASFFTNIYPWIPFIRPRVFYDRVLSSLMPAQIEHVLLIAAIKLVTTSPRDLDARSDIYRHIKATLAELEVMGQLTLRTLQALVVVALYELGHAIYPAAYLTIGQCARYGIALGLNQTIEATMERSWNPMDSEEERRTWWSIVILDRFVHLGCPDKSPVTAEPKGDSILPMDDHLWEVNETPISIHTLSSPPTPAMGRFGLTVQAGILLGRALRNLRDTSILPQGLPLTLQDDEAKVLKMAVSALAKVSVEEARVRGIGICGLTKICYSALLVLNTRFTKLKRQRSDLVYNENYADIKENSLYLASQMLNCATLDDTLTCRGPREEISPFLLDAIYRSAIIYMQEYMSTGNQDLLRGVIEFKSGLERINKRWKAAGEAPYCWGVVDFRHYHV